MKAARFYAAGDIRIDDVPYPEPKNDQVVIDIEWGGICGSDLHEYLIGPAVIPTSEQPHPVTQGSIPIILCHEFCGRISSNTPAGLKSANGVELKEGLAVMVDPRVNCQDCVTCLRDQSSNVCKSWGFLGLSGGGGGFAEKCAVKASMVYVLPESVDLRYAALIEPLAVGRRALVQCGIPADGWGGKSALVLGGGPVGLAVMYNLKLFGATKVFVSEPTALREKQCKELAITVFNPTKVSVPEECRKATGGEGVDVVFDCAGVGRAMMDGMDAVKRKGVYFNVAGWETPFTLPMQHFMMKEVTVKASMAYDERDFAATVVDFVAGRFKGVESMVTARIAIEDVQAKGFEQLVKHKDEHIKILATPRKELLS